MTKCVNCWEEGKYPIRLPERNGIKISVLSCEVCLEAVLKYFNEKHSIIKTKRIRNE